MVCRIACSRARTCAIDENCARVLAAASPLDSFSTALNSADVCANVVPAQAAGKWIVLVGSLSDCDPLVMLLALEQAGVKAVLSDVKTFTLPNVNVVNLDPKPNLLPPSVIRTQRTDLPASTVPWYVVSRGASVHFSLLAAFVPLVLYQGPAIAEEKAFLLDFASGMTRGSIHTGAGVNGLAWTASTDPCRDRWLGVTCSPDGHVTRLVLPDSSLAGPLPASFDVLTKVQMIVLPSNKISGPLPGGLSMSNCWHIDLSNNVLEAPEGGGPLTFSALPRLRSLDLSFNKIGAELHPTDLLPSFPSETLNAYANLAYNRITGSFPVAISPFFSLDLSNNRLSGSIAVPGAFSFGQPIASRLFHLDLSNNELSGTFPGENLVDLGILRISNNPFEDVQVAGSLKLRLEMARLNLRQGALDDFLVPGLTLDVLDVSANQLVSVNLPTQSGKAGINRCFFRSNNLTSATAIVSTCRVIDLSHNMLDSLGRLGAILASAVELQSLDLSFNRLKNEDADFRLSSIVGQTNSLLSLDVSNNALSGKFIPDKVLTTLEYLNIANNPDIVGDLADNARSGDRWLLSAFTSLRLVDISGTCSGQCMCAATF